MPLNSALSPGEASEGSRLGVDRQHSNEPIVRTRVKRENSGDLQDVMNPHFDEAVRGSIARSTPARFKSGSLENVVSLKDRMKGFASQPQDTPNAHQIPSTSRAGLRGGKRAPKEQLRSEPTVPAKPDVPETSNKRDDDDDQDDDSSATLDVDFGDDDDEEDDMLKTDSDDESIISPGQTESSESEKETPANRDSRRASRQRSDVKVRTRVQRQKSGDIQDVMHGQYDNAVRESIARSTPSRHKSASLNGMVSLKDRMKGFSAAGAETTKEKPTISSTPRMTKQSCKEECHGNKKVENEPSESSEYDSTSTASDEDDSETTLDLEDEENDGDFDLLEESASEVSLTEGTNLIQEVKEDDIKIKEILPGSTIANDVERQDRPKIRTAVKREKSGELGVMNFDFNDAVRNSIARSTPQRHKSSSLQGATSLKDRMKAFAK